ncbi:hypothetical protein M2284_002330 [Rhodococcus sp. LBL1]|nr:hypothetical protein [Rhodococcus sp. LBL1]MDH6683714.1 hypothetical protein [Rhodococcus sp. LBL2]
MSSRIWPTVLAALALAGTAVGLGVANPVPVARISTDRLGPDSGEQVSVYLDRAQATLNADGDADPATQHWALVSLDASVTPSQLLDVVGDVRVSQVLFHVPLDRAQTPMVAIPVAANRTAVERAPSVAAARLQASVVGHDRPSLLAAYSADQLSAGCACVVGATVRGSLDQLRALDAVPAVRAVEALPADAVAGSFAVSPLLPEQVDVVVPGPDDGEL